MPKVLIKRRAIDRAVIEQLEANGINPNLVSGYSIESADGFGQGVLVLRIPFYGLEEPATESDNRE